jgi:hypothetical protein
MSVHFARIVQRIQEIRTMHGRTQETRSLELAMTFSEWHSESDILRAGRRPDVIHMPDHSGK